MSCVILVSLFLMMNLLVMQLIFIIFFLMYFMKVRFMMKFATRYTPPMSPSVRFENPSMTDRSFKDECDINKIVERCMRVGWPEDSGTAQYGDFSNMPGTLQEAFDMMHDAEEKFAALPSDLRKVFDNDPAQFLLSFQDPSKKDLLVAHGLIDVPAQEQKAPPVVQPQETNVVNQPSDKGEP